MRESKDCAGKYVYPSLATATSLQDAPTVTTRGHVEVPQPLIRAIRRLTEASTSRGKAAELAAEVLPLLEAAVVVIRGVSRPSRRGTGEIEYLVEKTQQGEVLTERRLSGNSQPYRCPKAIYEAVADVLAKAERPLLLDEIVTGVEKHVGHRPSDFHVRLPLRFWMHGDHPTVVRNRARYSALLKAESTTSAQKLWEKISP